MKMLLIRPWQPTEWPATTLIRLRNSKADPSLRRAHMQSCTGSFVFNPEVNEYELSPFHKLILPMSP